MISKDTKGKSTDIVLVSSSIAKDRICTFVNPFCTRYVKERRHFSDYHAYRSLTGKEGGKVEKKGLLGR